jgi:predicted phage replisome organizer
MGDVKWIKFYVSILTSPKIKRIRRMPDGNTIALIWAYLLAQAGKSNKDGAIYFTDEIPYSDEDFAEDYNFNLKTVQLAMITFERFGMIEVYDGIIYVKNWEKYQNTDGLEKMKEQNRLRQAKYREKQKVLQDNVISNVTDNAEITQDNALDKEIEIEKEIKKNTVQDACTLFEKLWKLYPNKKGKGQVSDSKKKALLKIGEEELIKAIERYKVELKKDEDWRIPQNGSTFFNSGYEDYLDANYVPGNAAKPKTGNNKFNNFTQRDYSANDFESMEQKLLNRR